LIYDAVIQSEVNSRADNTLIGKEMTRIGNWMFRRRENNKLLNLLQEKARKDPQNCLVRVRLGNLLTEMGQKKAAIEVYHHAAEKFAQQGFIIEANAMSKVIMRLDPCRGKSSRRFQGSMQNGKPSRKKRAHWKLSLKQTVVSERISGRERRPK
jgi:hypothetical protein